MGLKARAEAALEGNKTLSASGKNREEIEIRHGGISEDEAEQFDWVADALVLDDTISLVVKYESEISMMSV
jgi:hypothetical protein